MALKKQIELNNGAIGEYWRLVSMVAINGTNVIHCNVALWKDKETRQEEGKEPIKTTSFSVEIDELSGEIFVKAYEALKLLNDFKGATDV